jgi:hypothetical protein
MTEPVADAYTRSAPSWTAATVVPSPEMEEGRRRAAEAGDDDAHESSHRSAPSSAPHCRTCARAAEADKVDADALLAEEERSSSPAERRREKGERGVE